jgi:hypothetical protein
MAQATSSRESSSKAEVSVYSDTLLTDSQNGNVEKRARRASTARHARKCTVCHHKDREFIDQDYLRWLSPKKIAREYAISHQSVVYRHADATGLRAQRRASLRATLENFIEQAESVRATAGSVVAAVRLYAQINDQGQWTPPVRRHIVEHRYTTESSAPAPTPALVPEKNGSPLPVTSAARPAAPLGVSPDKFGAVRPERNARAPQTTGGSPLDRPSPLSSNAAGSQAATSDAHSAAPTSASPEKFPAVSGSQKIDGPPSADSFTAHSAVPPAQAQKNSDPVNATGRLQPVATITAGCAVPFGASPDKFPAVPVASINFAADLPISNREHVELEHAATR